MFSISNNSELSNRELTEGITLLSAVVLKLMNEVKELQQAHVQSGSVQARTESLKKQQEDIARAAGRWTDEDEDKQCAQDADALLASTDELEVSSIDDDSVTFQISETVTLTIPGVPLAEAREIARKIVASGLLEEMLGYV